MLQDILSSKIRAEIFRLLFGIGTKELHLREISRQSGLAVGTVQQELKNLLRNDLIIARRDGNRVCYLPNTSHPLYPDIRNIVLKTAGLCDVLRSALIHPNIRIAFVFGSIAQQTEKSRSDVDLFIVGSLGLREASKLLTGVSEKIGREINLHVMTEDELASRRKKKEHFVSSVLRSKIIFVVGDAGELERLGK